MGGSNKEQVMKVLLSFVLTSFCFVASAIGAENVKNVVLVHGAFADGSSYSKIIPLLQKQGLNVVAVQNPLTSLSEDVAATDRTLNMLEGNSLLVGHSWGGAVITEASDSSKVSGLLYIAAFAPDKGKSANESVSEFPKTAGLMEVKPDSSGFAWLTQENLNTNFAQDVSADEQKVMFATQGPVMARNFDEKITTALSKDKPSWFIVASEDRMIQPDSQRAAAKRIGAQITEIKSSHVPMISKPQEVANVILAAVKRLNEELPAPVKQAEEAKQPETEETSPMDEEI